MDIQRGVNIRVARSLPNNVLANANDVGQTVSGNPEAKPRPSVMSGNSYYWMTTLDRHGGI
jgi:hypothetical protein